MADGNNYRPQIIWRGLPIGIFDNPRNDLWYLEGKWISNGAAAAEELKAIVQQFNTKKVFNNLELGTEAFLKSEKEENLFA